MALRQETRVVCEDQLISSYRSVEHLKHSCTQKSERLLRTWVDEKDVSRRIACSRESAVSVERYAKDWVVPLSWSYQIWQS